MSGLRAKRVGEWVGAGLIDAATADRIMAFEAEREKGSGRRWPILIALGFGGLLVAAGILLFVSANWDQMSPEVRFVSVLVLVGAFHVGGVFAAGRFDALATVLHAVGTITLGAGIFLAGQIFNLDEHWPSGVLLWAVGAWIGWGLRRDWAQLALAAILTPLWLESEWVARDVADWWRIGAPELGLFLFALAYVAADRERLKGASAAALFTIGAIALLPAGAFLGVKAAEAFNTNPISYSPPWSLRLPATPAALAVTWTVALAVPTAAAWLLRGRAAWLNLAAAAWGTILLNLFVLGDRIWLYPWLAVGAAGLAWWGLRESRAALVNLATAGFALTVLVFYFDRVMSKIGRSASLIGLGVLFLAGGYLLERVRRRMVGNVAGGRS